MRIAFFNPQGNFDPNDRYWTEHADFGGQLVYVKEVAMAMAAQGHQVDIITRLIDDPQWPGFSAPLDGYPGHPHVRIVRIPCGGLQFLNKEDLWPYLHEYAAGIISHYKQDGAWPDFVTTHYGDGGVSGALFQEQTGIPYSFTAHSLGAQKLDKFEPTPETIADLDRRFHFARRLQAEWYAMKNAAVCFVSTNQERLEQYSHPYYQGALDVHDNGKFAVTPPGVNTDVFKEEPGPADEATAGRIERMLDRDIAAGRRHLPCIVAASRLDAKKNHVGLMKAYAQSRPLQEAANLVITLRGIENPFRDISAAKSEEQEILRTLLDIYEEAKLAGKVTMFSLQSQQELASCYRVFAGRRSLFALTSLYEPFGLAPIEAMACGLPAVVTKNGGPSEVLRDEQGEYGVLVDPRDEQDMAAGLLAIVADEANFRRFQKAGKERVLSTYTWNQTARRYIEAIAGILGQKGESWQKVPLPEFFRSGSGDVTVKWKFE